MASSSHYQYSYVEDETQFSPELICTVCHDVAGTHTACPGCSQTFCQNCVHKWFDTQKSNAQGCTCPYCRRRLKFSDLKHDPKIQQQLNQLQVHCPNHQAGCTAIVARASVSSHLRRECWAQPCCCKFCGLEGLRREVSKHESCECQQRLVPCSSAAAGCSASVPLRFLQEHLEHCCPAAQRPCPHCQQPVPRSCWALHLQRGCPARQPCPLRLYGCSYSGSAQQVQQHSELCEYKQQRQQLEQQLSAGDGIEAAIAAAAAQLARADAAELPSSAVVDSYAAFGAPSFGRAAAHAGQQLLQAIPAAALPPRLQQEADWLVSRAVAAEASSKPAALAAQTAPKQIPPAAGASEAVATAVAEAAVAASTSSNSSSSSGGGSSSMSLVESLALGLPQCFTLVGLQSDPLLESCWRVLLNLSMFEFLSTDYADIHQLPSCFLLYTSLARAWEAVQSILGPQHQRQREQQQKQQQRARGGSSSSSSSSSGSGGAGDADEQLLLLPGIGRGLFEEEAEELSYYLWHQRQLLQAAAAATAPLTQLWLGLGGPALAPSQAVEVGELLQMAQAALLIIADVVGSGGDGSGRGAGSRDGSNQGGRGGGAAAEHGARPVVQMMHEGEQEMQRLQHSEQQQQQQTPQRRSAGWFNRLAEVLGAPGGEQQGAGGAAVPRGLGGQGQGLGGARARQQQQQQQGQRQQQQQGQRQQQQQGQLSFRAGTGGTAAGSAGTAAATAMDAAADPMTVVLMQAPSYSAALQQLQRIGAGAPLPPKRRTPELLRGLPPLQALELTTAMLLLSSARAVHVDTMRIPSLPPVLVASCRLFWGPSVLAGCGAWLGKAVHLGWQAAAVLNDMLMEVANRFMQALGQGFYDPDDMRVPLTPRMAMAAAQLVLPPALLAGCLEQAVGLSRAYHDEECEDLSEVTWCDLAARLGLVIELDKLVALVEERLPVSFDDEEEDEEDYMDEDEEDEVEEEDETDREGDESGSEYTTDDEYMQEQQHEYEQQQQQLLPSPHSTLSSGTAHTADAEAHSQPLTIEHMARTFRNMASAAASASSPAAGAAASPAAGSSSRQAATSTAAGSGQAAGGASSSRAGSSAAGAAAGAAAAAGGGGGGAAAGRYSGAASGSGSDGGWESADSDEAAAVLAEEYTQQLHPHLSQQQHTPGARSAAELVSAAAPASPQTPRQAAEPSSSSSSSAAAAAAAGPEQEMEQAGQQQQQQKEKGPGAAAAAAASPSSSISWHQQLASNLQQLAARSSGVPHLEQHLMQAAVQSVAWAVPGVAGGWGVQDSRGTAGQQAQPSQQQQQHERQQHQHDTAAPGSMQQQQQLVQHPAQESAPEAGDATNHGVVLIAGFLEAVLRLLLEAAGRAAEQEGAAAAAAVPAAAMANDCAVRQGGGVLVSARHVLLGVAGDADLSRLLLARPGKQGIADLAAVAWAGAVPRTASSLLPAPEREPLTAWLLQLAAGSWHVRQQDGGIASGTSSSSSRSVRVLFPADLRLYCGQGCQAGGRCCFLSGRQCGGCAAATAVLPAELDARLEVCRAGLTGLAVREGAAAAAAALEGLQRISTSTSSIRGEERLVSLTDAQLQQLMHMVRMYHLQQQWWYSSGASASDNSSGSDSGSDCASQEAAGWQCLPPVDQVQLANMQQLLLPLRDVVALREMQLQQAQDDSVWPMAHFEGMVHDALEQVCAERCQQRALVRRMQQLAMQSGGAEVGVGRPRAAAAAAAGGGSGGATAAAAAAAAMGLAGSVLPGEDCEATSQDDDMMELDIDPEALDLLATAAEDFMVQQLGAAGHLALHAAGRQEVGPGDLQLALTASGHSDMLAQLHQQALQWNA